MNSDAGQPYPQSNDSEEALKTLIRLASLAAHPDRPGGDTATMKRVNRAAELLRRGPIPTALGPCGFRPLEADRRMLWGKHRGWPMGELPLGYLGFLAEGVDDLDVRRAARIVLHWKTAP